jgi:uncharacterized membrane protein YgcG
MTNRSYTVALLVSSILALSLEAGCATQPPTDTALPAAQSTYPTSPSKDLDQLVAPIALYPDALVAQVLAAATYPTEIVEADRWLEDHSSLKGADLAKAVDQQPWDPSVQALTQFPGVLSMMDKNLSWTSALGDAYGNNQATVMEAVQRMRHQAQQAGNLKSTSQEVVTNQDAIISIAPADPEIVYVPEYDPWLVYGDPLAFYPGWVEVPGLFYDGPGIFFGVGIGIGVFGGFGWGWHHWGADWHHHFVSLDHHHFVSHSPTFGHFRPTGGPGAFGRPGAPHFDGSRGEGVHSDGIHGGGFRSGGFNGGGFNRGGFNTGDLHSGGWDRGGMRSSAFSGFNHRGVTGAFSSRGAASFGGFHGGGFHGGGRR